MRTQESKDYFHHQKLFVFTFYKARSHAFFFPLILTTILEDEHFQYCFTDKGN